MAALFGSRGRADTSSFQALFTGMICFAARIPSAAAVLNSIGDVTTGTGPIRRQTELAFQSEPPVKRATRERAASEAKLGVSIPANGYRGRSIGVGVTGLSFTDDPVILVPVKNPLNALFQADSRSKELHPASSDTSQRPNFWSILGNTQSFWGNSISVTAAESCVFVHTNANSNHAAIGQTTQPVLSR